LEALKNKELQLFNDLINERVDDGNTISKRSKTTNRKLVDIEAQYEIDNDKTLLQVATDEGNAEALKV
jgi:hypothetical protein